MIKKVILTVLSICFVVASFSQDGSVIGKWKSYFPFKSVIDIEKLGDEIYGATENGIVIHNYKEGTVEKLTEVNALSDNGISAIGINSVNRALVVGYTNGNVDIIIDNVTTNMFQIKSSLIIGDKQVYDVYCKENLAYLSCGFGIVVFDVKKKEVKDTYIIGAGSSQIRVNSVFIKEGIIYAGTESGLYSASETSLFLTDYNSWAKSISIPNPANQIDEIIGFNGKLIVNSINDLTSDSLFILNGSNWIRMNTLTNVKTENLYPYGDRLIVSHYDSIYVLDTNYAIIDILNQYDSYWKPKANCVIYDGTNYFIGDDVNSVVQFTSNLNTEFSREVRMYSNSVLDVDVEGGQLWISSGSVAGSGWNKQYNNDGVYHYDLRENIWTIYGLEYLTNKFCFGSECITDFIGVAVNPKSPKQAIGCAYAVKGMIELANNDVGKAYDSSNSSMQLSLTHGDRFAITDAEYDSDGNLWAINSWAEKPLLVKTQGGTWNSFDCGSLSNKNIVSKLIINNNLGYKWMIFKDLNIVVYNDNETPLDDSDDEYQVINNAEQNGNLEYIPTAIAEDLDEEVWIGTERGIFVIYNPEDIFEEDGDFEAQRIKIEQDGNIEYLLENEFITAIAIDGGNRKWIGTQSSGVFVLSSDGINQIHQFTLENSPLLSNTINDIDIDDETGEVFFSTDKGLISYKGIATAPQEAFIDVYSYPNPVPTGYSGLIGIRGLMYNSDIRITDISGNTVFATKSLGGQAIWDGNKLDGTRASSGVYLVFMVNENGTAKEVTKILFMK